MNGVVAPAVEARARRTRGASEAAIHAMVERAIDAVDARGHTFVDLGCGTGALREIARRRFAEYTGVDAVRYDEFPDGVRFLLADLDRDAVPLPDGCADLVAAIETVEHLENPRRLFREACRLAAPGAWILVSTPNQLSVLSKLTLVLRNEFNAFRDSSYPAHLTALLEVDLRRMAAECGLSDVRVLYSESGRVPGSAAHFPAALSRRFPRSFSDNLLVMGRVPGAGDA